MGRWLHLDPRTHLLIVILCAILAFTVSDTGLVGTLGAMFIYLCIQGLFRQALRYTLGFGILWGLRFVTDTYTPVLGPIFGFMVYYFMRFIPVLMASTALAVTSPGELIAALQKMHVPKSVIIPLAVGLRYLPTITHEYRMIQDAAQLRGVSLSIKGILKDFRLTLECALVPLLMRSLKISDELAASAGTRGIDFPGKRTSLYTVQIRFPDWVVIVSMLGASIGIWRFLP